MNLRKFYELSFLSTLFLYSSYISAFELGIGTHFQSYPHDSDYYLKLIKEYGFTSYRDDFSWSKIEREKDDYSVSKNIEKTDSAFLNAKKKYNLNGMVILDYGNPLYKGGAFPDDEETITAFANYAAWTASRYKDKVKYYEIWNEWSIGTGMLHFRDKIPPPEVYFELVKKTSEAIRKVDPEAIIVAGSLNPLEQRAKYINLTDTQWFEKLVQLGIMKYIDGVSLHTYSFLNRNRSLRSAEGNLEEIDRFHEYFSKLVPQGLSIYITEMGITNYDGPGGLSDEDAADFVRSYTNGAKERKYIKGLWWYDLINDGGDVTKREHNFGFFKNDNSPKKSAKEILTIMSQ